MRESLAKMSSVGLTELQRHLAQYIDRVERGESIVITRYGKPMAVLIPIPKARDLGLLRDISKQL